MKLDKEETVRGPEGTQAEGREEAALVQPVNQFLYSLRNPYQFPASVPWYILNPLVRLKAKTSLLAQLPSGFSELFLRLRYS